MKLKKSIRKKINIAIIVVVVIAVLGIMYLGYKRFFTKTPVAVKPKVVDTIENYGYELEEGQTALYKKLYDELSKELKKDKVDEEKYASYVASLIVCDFYNLDNKISKNDIGGVQFVRQDQQKNFILEASETVYKYIEHNVYGNRKQELPVVKHVEVKDVTETTYKYEDIDDEKAYKVNVLVTYEKDLGYPTEVTVVLVHAKDNDKKLEVIKMY